VSRIGRKYLYVSLPGGRELRSKFHVADDQEDSMYGTPGALYTSAQWAEFEERRHLIPSLKGAVLVVDATARGRLSTDKLRRIMEILKESEEM
jgi:signal recognition particle receptor subunit beta